MPADSVQLILLSGESISISPAVKGNDASVFLRAAFNELLQFGCDLSDLAEVADGPSLICRNSDGKGH